jgi:hypothetical protein
MAIGVSPGTPEEDFLILAMFCHCRGFWFMKDALAINLAARAFGSFAAALMLVPVLFNIMNGFKMLFENNWILITGDREEETLLL